MRTIQRGSLLLALVVCFGASAQEPGSEAAPAVAEVDELEPAVSSKDLLAGADEAEPAAPTAVLSADVRRTESGTGVMDELALGRTEITGNQELPKVLYIVPWQKSDPGDLTGKPVNTLLDEVLAPIDRSEFLRQVEYYGDLYPEQDE